ncbi:MAG: chromosome segregation protein SMC [Bacteroidia bacterium]|nr:chromosome segregation protein SMC [Bacteroidia bacterium]
MKLTSLEIFGFKSFANREKLVFDQGITGIVGPNGCGKSNIVDAIRWVLGEQRSSSLRSDKMENVIFNGASERRKAHVAEVSLTFENTRNLLPVEYSTVTVTRKLYRSGESEYFINGVACRLKDIQDLFMDTGISSDSYAIIELKMVDEILTNKDNDRRRFFEEAAGISKYKLRKKQTLKKLEETDADLERVEDLLFEIDKNLKSLEKQARRTQRYFELKEQYRLVSAQFAFLGMRSIRDRQRQIQLLEQQTGDQASAQQAELSLREARLLELRKELVDAERELAEAQADLNRHLRQIQSVETEKSIKNERLKYLQQRELAIRNQMETDQRQQERNRSALAQLDESRLRLEAEEQEQQARETSVRTRAEELRLQAEARRREVQELDAEHRSLELEQQAMSRDKEVRKVQIQSLQAELQRTEEDRFRREEDLDAFSETGSRLRTETAALESQIRDLEARRDQHRQELDAADAAVTALKDALYKSNRQLDARQNEYNLTRSLVENLEGFPASVKFLKKHAQWMKDAPLLSDIFTVPEPYKVVFENYLEPYLSYYVVPSRQDAVLSVHLLAESAKGRANFFILDELESYKPANPLIFTQAAAALDLIETAPAYKRLAAYLFDRVYLVNDERDIPDDPPEEMVFMTRSGSISRRRYAFSGGALGLFEGKRLGRARNLENLEKEIAALRKQLTAEKSELEQQNARLDALKRVDFTKDLETLRKQLGEKQRDLSVLQSREAEYREFLARAGQRTDTLTRELDALQAAVAQLDPQLRFKLEELQQTASRLVRQREAARELAEAAAEVQQALSQEQIRLIHVRNQLGNVLREAEQKAEASERYEEVRAQLLQELAAVKADLEGVIASNLQDDGEIVALHRQKEEKERRVGIREERVHQVRDGILQVEQHAAELRRKRDELTRRQQELHNQASDIRIEYNSLRDRMAVEFQMELGDLREEDLFDKPLDTFSITEVEERLLKARQQVQGFGEINPMAVEAYQEMKERYDFIQGQRADLIAAKQSLLDTIGEIDQTAKEKFLETFVQVREHFQRVFRTLFSEDDSCDLLLMDEENPLESDISILARPKGKRPLTIKQLSGGEKTLTAVALLFSIYLIKPAPFCIFDEVDAPLDDANIDKFNNIIRDFSATSQFIIVTHNKRTMASTQIMYGVTMETAGVSRVVPVSLEALNLN